MCAFVTLNKKITYLLTYAHSPDVASGTVARRLRIDVHDANDDDDNDNA